MIIKSDTFYIDTLNPEDASSLSSLMVSNGRKFQQYFPKTLSQNISEEASKSYISRKAEEHQNQSEFTFAIKDLDCNTVAGLVILKEIDWAKKQGEFAYCMSSKYEGKRWTSKAIKEISKYAFAELGLEILQIIVHKDNIASVNVAKNGNFTWLKTLKNEYTPPNGNTLDMELYELTTCKVSKSL